MTLKLLKKVGCIVFILLLVLAVGCGKNNEPGPGPVQQEPQNEEPQNEEPAGPVSGGILRVLMPSGPVVLGWSPEFAPSDYAFAMVGVEPLLAVSSDRGLEGVLAENFDEDPENMTITYYLRKGVKFHDGSDFNADVVLWNNEMGQKYSQLQGDDVREVVKVDDYTVRYELNRWTNQLLEGLGISLMFSKHSFEQNGGEEGGGIEWARFHPVGTGPFKLKEFNRDNNLIWEKNENYWGEGPYLDGIEIRFVPDAGTAQAMMEAGDADMWSGAVPAQNQKELEEKGFVRQSAWAGIQSVLVPNTVDTSTPLADLRVREAIEYAINKQGICDVLGYGYLEPLNTVAPPGDWGGDKVFRPYDPDKAKQLLAEAGYPNGFETTLVASASSGGRNEVAEALVGMLGEVGIKVNLDIADTGRFTGMMFGNGWDGLMLGFSGQDTTYLTSTTRWWGHNAFVYPSMYKSEEFLEMCRESVLKTTREEQKAITEQIVYYMAENVMVIPLTNSKTGFIRTPKVHTDYLDQGMTRWRTNLIWLEK
ncbi:MAG TPA: ABC transporter substrate-binding protein [Firmicutes bacterium]|nr:ABC transporter substrate-binding protein [Bacillota bacterium]